MPKNGKDKTGWTGRFKRFFVKKKKRTPINLSASQIIRPEQLARQNGRPPPRSTTRRKRRPDPTRVGHAVMRTPWGVTHVMFPRREDISRAIDKTITVRDPVTRRLSRRKLDDGLRRTTSYYKRDGELFDETGTNW
jgi:hypothetical protein